MPKTETILAASDAGFIGSNLCQFLIDKAFNIVCLDTLMIFIRNKLFTHSPEIETNNSKYFDENLTTKDMIANFKFELRNWALAKFDGSRKKAVLHFQNLGYTTPEKTLDNWKNKK